MMTQSTHTGQKIIGGIKYGSALILRTPVAPVTLFACGATEIEGNP